MQTDPDRRLTIGLISAHTSPLSQPGGGDAGGLNVYVRQLARGLGEEGHTVHVFTRRTGADLPDTVALEPTIFVHHLDAGPLGVTKEDLTNHLCAVSLAMEDHPALEEIDVLHAHYWMSGWVGHRLSRRRDIPMVQTFHTLGSQKNASLAPLDTPEGPLRVAAESQIAEECAAIIAPTKEEEAFLAQTNARPRVVVVEPGVDLAVFNPHATRSWAEELVNPDNTAQVVLFVGRLQPLKGPDTAIRALAQLHSQRSADRPPLRLVLIGAASGNGRGTMDQASLAELAHDLGIGESVAFLKPRPHDELAALYCAADVVVMPSHSESFGLVALEAQACGTPVVATNTGGLSHVVGDGGVLVSPHTTSGFADGLAVFLDDEDRRERAGKAGVEQAKKFTWKRTTQLTLEVYRRVVASAPIASRKRATT